MWTGETIPALFAGGVAAGLVLRFTLHGVAWVFGFIASGVRAVMRGSS